MNKRKHKVRPLSSQNLICYKLPPTPQNAKNQNYFNTPSPSKFSENLFHSSVNDLNLDPHLNKFYSFKKIRQNKVKQKNDQGKVIMHRQALKPRISDLNEARSIFSNQSLRSSNIEVIESQIIDRGIDIFKDNFQNPEIFQKKILNKNKKFQKFVHNQINFLLADNGSLYYYEIITQNVPQQLMDKLKKLNRQQYLSLYNQQIISVNTCLLIYEPFEINFVSYIIRLQTLSFQDIIDILMQIVKQMVIFNYNNIYPIIQLTNIVVIGDQLKLKIQKLNENKKDMVKDIGIIGHQIVNNIRGQLFIKNFSKKKKVKFNTLMMDLLTSEFISLEDACIHLNALKGI